MKNMERAKSRLLEAAQLFCQAEQKIREGRPKWKQLWKDHNQEGVICLRECFGSVEICEACQKFVDDGLHTHPQLVKERQRQKRRMMTAFGAIRAAEEKREA